MRTFLLGCLLASSLSSLRVTAQQPVTFSPEKPQPGATINLAIDGKAAQLPQIDQLMAVAYILDVDSMPRAQEVKLQRQGTQFTGSFTTNKNDRAVSIGFPKRTTFDKVKGLGYYTYLYGSDGQPVPGARAALGQSSRQFGDLWQIEADAAVCLALQEEDLQLNPALKSQNMRFYLSTLLQSKKEADKSLLQQEVDRLVADNTTKEADLEYLKSFYARLKQTARVQEVDSLIKGRYPDGAWKRYGMIVAMMNERDVNKKEALYKQLVTAYPATTPAQERELSRYASSLSQAFLAQDNIAKTEEYYKQVTDKAAQATVCNEIGWKLSGESVYAKASNAPLGKKYSALSLQLQQELIDQVADKPPYYSNTQWKEQLEGVLRNYYDTYALLLYQLKDYKNAYAYQEKALGDNRMNAAMNEAFAVYAEKAKGTKAAQEFLESCVRTGKVSPKMKEQLKRLYLAQKHTEAQWTGYLAELQKESNEKKRAELAQQMLQEAAPAFALKDLQGQDVSLASLKGKIVIVDFWATWCGPCLASFPGMKMAVEKYKNDPDVKFVFIDTRESGEPEKVKKDVVALIEKNAYPFHVLMDYDSKVIESYKVSGIPTKFVIDGNSMVRFKKVGFNGSADDTMEEIITMIEMTKAAGNK